MSDLVHWHGTPGEFTDLSECCRLHLEKRQRAAIDQAVHDEARRIVTGGVERLNAYEAAILTVVKDDTSRTLIETVVTQCREALAAVGCICPRADVTGLGDAEPQYLPGLSSLCGVHGQGMRRPE